MSELLRRFLFALPAGALFIWLLWIGGLFFELLLAGIALAVLLEMIFLFRKMNGRPVAFLALLTGAVAWSLHRGPDWLLVAGAILMLGAMTSILYRKTGPEGMNRWGATLFCGLYAPLGLLFFHEIRYLAPETEGVMLAILVIVLIWSNDIFAYGGGRLFGKRPLAPSVSPNKSWEGFWFGMAGSLIALLLMVSISDSISIDGYLLLPMVPITGVMGPLGDLAESRFKRWAGVKDSSRLLPGHGGFFDRFDALILASPFLWVYLVLIL
ncbi:MAG: phosphatidate cytidylyltransferase [Balneolaceae bacterium]